MITISIDPEGGITLSQETAGERAVMSNHYAAQEGMSETEHDEERAAFFKQGWEAATREAMHNFVRGRLVEYFQEIGGAEELSNMNDAVVAESSEDPHHNEPEGTGEDISSDPDFEDNWTAADWEGRDEVLQRTEELPMDADAIKPVVDSGEPELEKNQTWDPADTGTWTMSSEELQSRLDAAYNRGAEQKKQTTALSVQMMAVETANALWPDGYAGLSKRDVFGALGVELARKLGWVVN